VLLPESSQGLRPEQRRVTAENQDGRRSCCRRAGTGQGVTGAQLLLLQDITGSRAQGSLYFPGSVADNDDMIFDASRPAGCQDVLEKGTASQAV
jgi:hypothetical protein